MDVMVPESGDVAELDYSLLADPDDVGPGTRGRTHPVAPEAFLYIGDALTAEQFTEYVENYDIGSIPPDFIVLHHTYIPYTRQTTPAGQKAAWAWDADSHLGIAELKQARLRKLFNIREYYRTQPGYYWDRGPHLFIDDRFIYLFTPMYEWGIHAGAGNKYGTLPDDYHYSIGIEVIGYYDNQRWPESTARLVGHAIAVMQRKWKSFELVYKKFAGGISMHRDYTNKKSCPGRSITPDYFLPIIREAQIRLNQSAGTTLSPDSPILGAESGRRAQVAAYLKRVLPDSHEYKDYDVELILGYYWHYAPQAGVDPFLAVVHSILETNAWQSPEAARPNRNPARLGQGSGPGGVQAFPTWEESVQAHVNYLKEQGQSGRRLRDLRGHEYAERLSTLAREVTGT